MYVNVFTKQICQTIPPDSTAHLDHPTQVSLMVVLCEVWEPL